MHRTSRLICAPAFGLAFGLFATVPATAGSAGGSFQVNATVVSACSVTGSLLNFGTSLDPVASAVPIDATSTLTVQCTNTTPYAVSLNAGLNAGGASV
ncbi:spore coat protein U domain-containing protein, partial [Salmonella enterica]|uniref:spore coat protein U domain-containing protein n=1 Tax=Salmonella enterica TaxID=28901 RepID=UPI003FA70C29